MEIRRKKRGAGIWPYLLLAPALLIMLSVVIIPIINAVSMSFQSYNLTRPKKIAFIAFQNYEKILQSSQFWSSLGRTGIWVLWGVGLQFVFGFALALLLNKNFRGRGIVRSVSLIPWVTPGVLIALMWRWILDGNYGVLNDILKNLGIISDNIAFLASKQFAMPSVIMTIVWQGIPFFALMILAGLQSIPEELYEAANIDGASGLQKLFYVTIPSLKNTIFVTTMLRIIWVANSVDVIYNMTEGGPAFATQTLSVYIYKEASVLNMGYASAMAILLMLVLMVAAIPYLRTTFSNQEA
ncbi:MAG: sugar ABC transporter permease [Clostridiales bacterium]|nr:sugar ABC transporter permease [Clostridiales bacterium]MDO4350435.1 sugar ABC transporter permease [Eubacteriales bacterium]MDY4007443.1 sugar ABC transporter permease [Candidatus Limiplasma sp.]